MDSLRAAYNDHAFILWLALLVLVVLVGAWVSLVQSHQRRLSARMEELLGGISGDGASNMLAEYLGIVRHTAASMDQMKSEHQHIAALMPTVIRHVGLVRFSPFHDTGGDQSFALALLDGEGNGVMVTALHSRSDSRLYAKPLEHGSSDYALTPEEREAIDRALRRSPVGSHT